MPKQQSDDLYNLTEREKRFAEAIINGVNATKAAIAAGFSPHSARSQASRMLTKRNIQNYIKAMSQKMENTAVANAEEALTVVSELLRDSRLKPADRIKSANLIIRVAGATSTATPGAEQEEDDETECDFYVPFNYRDMGIEIGAIQFNGAMLTNPKMDDDDVITYIVADDILRYSIWKSTNGEVDIDKLPDSEKMKQIQKYFMKKETEK